MFARKRREPSPLLNKEAVEWRPTLVRENTQDGENLGSQVGVHAGADLRGRVGERVMDHERLASIGARLRLAQVIACTEAEGPGRRFAVWVQGCPLRCPGCCNPEMLPFEGGHEVGVDELAG